MRISNLVWLFKLAKTTANILYLLKHHPGVEIRRDKEGYTIRVIYTTGIKGVEYKSSTLLSSSDKIRKVNQKFVKHKNTRNRVINWKGV